MRLSGPPSFARGSDNSKRRACFQHQHVTRGARPVDGTPPELGQSRGRYSGAPEAKTNQIVAAEITRRQNGDFERRNSRMGEEPSGVTPIFAKVAVLVTAVSWFGCGDVEPTADATPTDSAPAVSGPDASVEGATDAQLSLDAAPSINLDDPNVHWYVSGLEERKSWLRLQPGWNLVQLRHEPPALSMEALVAEIMPSLVAVWGWDGTTQKWQLYAPGLPAAEIAARCDSRVVPLERLEAGRGYWFHMRSAATGFVPGLAETPTRVPGGIGWWLVGLGASTFEGAVLATPERAMRTLLATKANLWGWSADDQRWKVYSSTQTIDQMRAQFGEELVALKGIAPGDGLWLATTGQRASAFKSPGPAPGGMFFDGNFVYVQAERMYRIDPTSGEAMKSFEGGFGGDATWDGKTVWSMAWSKITRQQLVGDRLVTVYEVDMQPELHHMTGMAWDGKFLYAVMNTGTFYKLDPANVVPGAFVEVIQSGLEHITHVEAVNGLFYALDGTQHLYVLDPGQSMKVVDSFIIPGARPAGIAWDGNAVWVADMEGSALFRIAADKLSRESLDPLDDYLREDDAATPLAQSLSEDRILTASGSPYVVTDFLDVPRGVTLTLEPGTRLLVGPNAFLNVWGRIVATGTPGEPVVISHRDPAAAWGALHINDSGDPAQPASILRHTRIQYANTGLGVSGAKASIEYSWIRALPTGINTGGGFNVAPPAGSSVTLVGNVGAPVRLMLGTEPDTVGARVEIVENHLRGILLFDGQNGPTGVIRRNMLDGPLVVDETSHLVIEDNQLGEPAYFGEYQSMGNLHEDYVFSRNLVVSDYQVNGVHGNVRGFVARKNTVTNGFGFWDVELDIDLRATVDLHQNNILGGVGEWMLGDDIIRPHASLIQTLPTQVLDLTANYWGTTDPAAVARLIWDNSKDGNEGTILYEPYLTAPVPVGFVRGLVYDASSGVFVSGASVVLGDEAGGTAADGAFVLSAAAGTAQLHVKATGFKPRSLDITVAPASLTHVELGLWPTTSEVPPGPAPRVGNAETLAYPPVPPGFPLAGLVGQVACLP
ncbi:MAG: carboxypeptidase regulatory-like domain-containing protein [Deltaproteobacteria bacterium]|nr:carboxypeptidase regulatory-like domain-containing protein [Deltaproteobacteria bacterium]